VQVGLLPDVLGWPAVPLHLVIAGELELLGSHGMAAWRYPELLGLVAAGRLRPGDLVTARVALDDAGAALAGMGDAPPTGIVVAVP
jgi:alcohol dehydrogenase